jgi:CheY-like chemotaxis protein
MGADMFECATLIDCVENFDNFEPDLILLDLKLEFESGVDFLKYRESMPTLSRIPVVIISSHAEPDLIKECISHGIKDFIKKPFDSLEQIEARLTKINF